MILLICPTNPNTLEKKNMAGPPPFTSSEDSPEFFKVYLPIYSSIQMSIPQAFVNQLNARLPEKAILEDDTGKSWHVVLERIDKDVYFTTGWAVFVRDQVLERGDFLIFKYCGNSLFHVKIFSINGCEKDIVDNDVKIEQENEEDYNEDAQTHSGGITHLLKHKRDIEIAKSSPFEGNRQGNSSKHATTKMEQHRIQETINSVSPGNNYYVLTDIATSYRYGVLLPKSFLKAYQVDFKHAMFLYTNQNNKSSVRISVRVDGRCALNSTDWKDFSRKNNIGIKDKCVFEAVLGTSNICEEIYVQVINYCGPSVV